MSEFKGTKGKWFACCLETTPHFVFDEIGETVICKPIHNQEMRVSMPNEEYKANALLISKAPELLEFIKSVFLSENIPVAYRKQAEKLIKQATEL